MKTAMSYEHFIQVAELRTKVLEAAARYDFAETPKALLFAERCHAGQRRKGPANAPLHHPPSDHGMSCPGARTRGG